MSEPESAAHNAKRGNAPKDWPNTIAAAASTGLNRKQLERMRARGALVAEKSSDGVTRWNPDMLALVAEAREDSDDEDESLPVQARTEALNGQAFVLLKQAQGHTEAAFRLVLDPMRDLLKARETDIERLRARVEELEGKLNASYELREKMQSEQHLRDLLTSEAQQSSQRKDRMLELVKEHAPKLLTAINPAATQVVQLLRSLSPEQRGLLLETDFLDAEQKKHVASVLQGLPALNVVDDTEPPPPPEQKDEPAA